MDSDNGLVGLLMNTNNNVQQMVGDKRRSDLEDVDKKEEAIWNEVNKKEEAIWNEIRCWDRRGHAWELRTTVGKAPYKFPGRFFCPLSFAVTDI